MLDAAMRVLGRRADDVFAHNDRKIFAEEDLHAEVTFERVFERRLSAPISSGIVSPVERP